MNDDEKNYFSFGLKNPNENIFNKSRNSGTFGEGDKPTDRAPITGRST